MIHRRRFIALMSASVSALAVREHVVAQDEAAPDATVEAQPNDAPVQIAIFPQGTRDGTRFEAEIEAGTSGEMVARIESHGPTPIRLRTFAPNVLPVLNGGLGVDEIDSERVGPATWLDYQTEELTLATGEGVDKPFTISVPDGTEPGQYINALVLETVDPISAGEGSSFEQFTRKVIALYVLVPGAPLEAAFTLGDPVVSLAGNVPVIQFPVENTGNVRIDLAGNVLLTAGDGTQVAQIPIRLGPIYKDQATLAAVGLVNPPPEGDYIVSIDLADEEQGVGQQLVDKTISIPSVEVAAIAPVAFEEIAITANADPIQFANVTLNIVVTGSAIPSSELTMSVSRNQEPVEDFVLASNLTLPIGSTAVSQRYIPATGWEAGTWTFSLRLESVDPSGARSVLLRADDVATLEVA